MKEIDRVRDRKTQAVRETDRHTESETDRCTVRQRAREIDSDREK